MESTLVENLEKLEHDFTITSSGKTPLGTSTQNILTKMNIMSQYLADVFYLPLSERSKKSYKRRVITEGRTITDKEHQALYKEKEEIKSRKEKRRKMEKKQERKKQETKLIKDRTKN